MSSRPGTFLASRNSPSRRSTPGRPFRDDRRPPASSELPDELPFVAAVDDRYGPSAMVTPANAVTIIRLLLSPALLVMILAEPSSWGAVCFWIALAVTDGVDGHLARRFGTTRSGAFLDPLADKVLVLGAMFALVAADRFWILPVALITIREVTISLFRTRLGRQGLAVPARKLAKVKTVVQELAVGFALLPLTVEQPARRQLGPLGGHRAHPRHRRPVPARRSQRGDEHGARPDLTGCGLRRCRRCAGQPARDTRNLPVMRCEVVAIGTELLLGQIVDTNSAWIGEQLALAGIDSHFQTKVGDNLDRMVEALQVALGRNEAVICCGGLGPTQDDITRDAIARVMGVRPGPRRGDRRHDPPHVPVPGPRHVGQQPAPSGRARGGRPSSSSAGGPRPGLICPVGDKVIYAVPGVPYEMTEMLERAILPDLRRRSGSAEHDPEPHAADVGRERVGAGRAAGRPDHRAGRAGQPDDRVPRQRHRGAEGPHHRQGPGRGVVPRGARPRGARPA